MSAPSPATLSRLLLELYGDVPVAGATRLRQRALTSLAPHLPFTGAAWATGVMTSDGALFHDIDVRGLAPGFAQAIRATAALDPTSHKLAAASARSFVHSRADYPAEVVALAGNPDDLQSSVEGMIHDETTGLFTSVCLFRNSSLPPFSETERALHELLHPHWMQAHADALISAAFRASFDDAACATSGVALALKDGLLAASCGSVAALLCDEWPGWAGGRLPEELLAGAGSAREWRYLGARLFARLRHVGTHLLVEIREREAIDTLGRREREVAALLCEGLSAKTIAARLGISRSTVQNHRDHIYRKVGVSSRAALVKAWRRA